MRLPRYIADRLEAIRSRLTEAVLTGTTCGVSYTCPACGVWNDEAPSVTIWRGAPDPAGGGQAWMGYVSACEHCLWAGTLYRHGNEYREAKVELSL